MSISTCLHSCSLSFVGQGPRISPETLVARKRERETCALRTMLWHKRLSFFTIVIPEMHLENFISEICGFWHCRFNRKYVLMCTLTVPCISER